MGKYSNKEAYYSRLQQLAQTDKSPIKETRNIGDLVDFKRDANGVAYGIIKENHNYYIKKGGISENLNASDFAYIGGLENITMYQYHSISEADKQRDLLLKSINEASNLTLSKTSTKLIIKEDVAAGEIEKSEEKLDDLDAATAEKQAAETQPEPTPEIPDLADDEPIPAEEPVDGGEEPVDGGEPEVPAEEPVDGGEEPVDGGEEGTGTENQEIQKKVGEVAELVRNTEMDDAQVKSYINSFLAAFKEKLPNIEISDRKKMADKLIKVVDQDELNDLEQSMPADAEMDENLGDDELCNECGSFTKFAESRGYDKDSIKSCSIEEMANLISGYANAYNEGLNEGCAEEVAVYANNDVVETLVKEYGHDDYVNEVIKPEIMKLSEATDEDKSVKIDEFWAGLGRLGNKAAQGIKTGVQNVATNVANKAKAAAQDVKQTYYTGEKNAAVKKLEQMAISLGQQIAAVNSKAVKAGEQPINVGSILTSIRNQVQQGNVDLGRFKTAEGVDAGYTEADKMLSEFDEEPDKPESEVSFGAPQTLGVTTPATNPTSITIDGNNKTVSVSMNESAGKPKYPNGHVLAGKSTIKSEPEKLSNPTTNLKGVPTVAKKTQGHVMTSKSTIKSEPEKLSTPTTNLKGVPTVAKKTQGHVMASNSTIKTKPEKAELSEEKEKPSADLTKKEKSAVVKKAKAGEDIGKKGKGFKDVAAKAAKEYGSKEKGEKVAAAAMWKNIKEGVETMSESEMKIRKYVRMRLEEKCGLRKPMLNEDVKSERLKKLDEMIDKQFELLNKK